MSKYVTLSRQDGLSHMGAILDPNTGYAVLFQVDSNTAHGHIVLTFDELAELCAAFLDQCPECDPEDRYTLTPEAKQWLEPQPTSQPSPAR